jgi:hypothetical protein
MGNQADKEHSYTYLVQAAGITRPVNLVAARAATTRSGVVPPHSESGYCRNGCQLVAYLMRGVLRVAFLPLSPISFDKWFAKVLS